MKNLLYIFYSFILSVFFIASLLSAADFREKPLDSTQQEKLDTLIDRLGSNSGINRAMAQREIIALGSRAIETLHRAENHPNFTIADSVKYCLSVLEQGIVRADDSPNIQPLLKKYTLCASTQKMIFLMLMSQLPAEESLTPLLRIVFREEDACSARFAALAVFRTLPAVQDFPEFPVPVPEAKVFPDREEWNSQNETNRIKRQELLTEIRQYMEAEAGQSEGTKFLARLLALEKILSDVGNTENTASSWENAPTEAPQNKDSTQISEESMESDSNKLNLTSQLAGTAFAETFQSLYEGMEPEDPVELILLHEFLYWGTDLLLQAGFREEGKTFFKTQTATKVTDFGNAHYTTEMERNLCLNYRIFLIQLLVRQGYWNWAANEAEHLNMQLSGTEKIRHLSSFASILTTIGEFRTAWEYTKEVRRLIFINLQSNDEENSLAAELKQRLNTLLALDSCMEKNYSKAKELLSSAFNDSESPDIDALILARKIAIYTKDEEWKTELEKRINESLEKTIQELPDASNVKLRANQLNQFAWLAANTERRLEEAQKYAEEAVQLLPEATGIQDTLAMVYFALGDYEKAFEIQSKAVAEESTEMELWVNLERIRVYRNEKKSEKVE